MGAEWIERSVWNELLRQSQLLTTLADANRFDKERHDEIWAELGPLNRRIRRCKVRGIDDRKVYRLPAQSERTGA